MPQTLEQLLRDADAASSPPEPHVEIAPIIYRRRSRQLLIRRVALAAVVVITASLGAFSLRPRPQQPIALVEPPSPAPQVSVASLEFRARLHELTAERLLKSHHAHRARAAATSSPESEIQFQRDRAALILVYDADLHAKQNRPAEAIASYRRAIELFPQTHWANVARQRLKQMST